MVESAMGASRAIVLMGVTGSGKTTVGEMLAQYMQVPFLDGDDYHPEENVAKMASGTPLTDEDRFPWLQRLARELGAFIDRGETCILACSALRREYRRILRGGRDSHQVCLVHLAGSEELIASRLSDRAHRYMPASLLRSQFEALEEPEDAISIDISGTPQKIVEKIADVLGMAHANDGAG
ncbi:MAG: gluconokinase [Candidatus Latescibacterota bacterium]|nr:gluconokinase [Candidatus Latescibacterota bacterium]